MHAKIFKYFCKHFDGEIMLKLLMLPLEVKYAVAIVSFLAMLVGKGVGLVYSLVRAVGRGLKGIANLVPTVVSLALLGFILVALAYTTSVFKESLNTTDSTITQIFDAITGFYSLVASFLSPIGTIVLMAVIIAIMIGVFASRTRTEG